MATSTPGSPAQGVHNSFLHDLHLDKLSSGDWQRVSLAVGSRLHPVLNGSVLNISAQRVLRCANSKRIYVAIPLSVIGLHPLESLC